MLAPGTAAGPAGKREEEEEEGEDGEEREEEGEEEGEQEKQSNDRGIAIYQRGRSLPWKASCSSSPSPSPPLPKHGPRGYLQHRKPSLLEVAEPYVGTPLEEFQRLVHVVRARPTGPHILSGRGPDLLEVRVP